MRTLFLATNLAVLVVVSIIFNFWSEGILTNNGVDLNLSSLLFFAVCRHERLPDIAAAFEIMAAGRARDH